MANQPRVSDATHKVLRMASVKYQFELNRQVSMGDIIAAALSVATNHPDELKAALNASSK